MRRPHGQHLERASLEIRATFQALLAMLKTIGPFQITALKTMLTFSTGSNFGGVTVRKARLDVGFFLPRLEQVERVVRVEKLSPRKIAHYVHLTSPEDVDRQLEAWFREAFEIGSSGPSSASG